MNSSDWAKLESEKGADQWEMIVAGETVNT